MNKEAQIGDNTQNNKSEIQITLNPKQRDTLIAVLLAAPENREICSETVAALIKTLLIDENTLS
jgi:hypothetical protein